MEGVVDMGGLSLFARKSVLVTGHTGFKGSWLCLWLRELGAEVTGYALPPEHAKSHFNLLGLDSHIRHHEADVRDMPRLMSVMGETQPEFVFHLAAQSLVRRSYEDPQGTFATNVGGSVNLLEAVRETPSVRTLVYITSDKCYRNKEWLWGYRENDELGGRDPYSASKAAAEMAFQAYLDSFFRERPGFGAASVRAGNVIGGGDRSSDRIVPDVIGALERQEPVVLRNPRAIRPWQHVLDPLHGYLRLAAALAEDPARFSGAWNFGPDEQAIRTVDDLARALVRAWGSGDIRHATEEGAPHEATLLHLSIDKARRLLGWRPSYGFEEATEHTARWYRAVSDGKSPLALSRGQIQDFMKVRAAA